MDIITRLAKPWTNENSMVWWDGAVGLARGGSRPLAASVKWKDQHRKVPEFCRSFHDELLPDNSPQPWGRLGKQSRNFSSYVTRCPSSGWQLLVPGCLGSGASGFSRMLLPGEVHFGPFGEWSILGHLITVYLSFMYLFRISKAWEFYYYNNFNAARQASSLYRDHKSRRLLILLFSLQRKSKTGNVHVVNSILLKKLIRNFNLNLASNVNLYWYSSVYITVHRLFRSRIKPIKTLI